MCTRTIIGNEFVHSSSHRELQNLVTSSYLNEIINNFGMTTPTIVGVSVGVVSWPLHFLGASYTYGRGLTVALSLKHGVCIKFELEHGGNESSRRLTSHGFESLEMLQCYAMQSMNLLSTIPSFKLLEFVDLHALSF